jgi:hypothetical protein
MLIAREDSEISVRAVEICPLMVLSTHIYFHRGLYAQA